MSDAPKSSSGLKTWEIVAIVVAVLAVIFAFAWYYCYIPSFFPAVLHKESCPKTAAAGSAISSTFSNSGY
jgi:uncharacterized membrane protein YbhN (UPF0104 family)